MNAASTRSVHQLRPEIVEKRMRLEAAAHSLSADYVDYLLGEIDAALEKIDGGSYGLCETCHDPIEPDRLNSNPLVRFCLDHLTSEEIKAHERDLELATQIQTNLLPPRQITTRHWEAHYRYEPAGVVGGDYCEIAPTPDGNSFFFAIGDVSGKGVAASLLMSHLSAIFRSLLSLDLPLADVILRANRLLCESTPATHYATLVAGRATESGVELCNAGHCRPLLFRRNGMSRIEPSGLPLGLFCDGRYTVTPTQLEPEDTLVLYTDGITEAQDAEGNQYEEDRLIRSLRHPTARSAFDMADRVLRDVARFTGTRSRLDDLTLLIVRRRSPEESQPAS
jgi:sigma-B regulation protein RsbU (phosphoserine phosphatase)